MKKKLLALSVLAAISSQANAFQFDTPDDWQIRWDNTFKANVMSRVNKADDQVTRRANGYFLSRDSDWSVDRSGGGLVSTRVDVLSEMDVIWKDNFGFRVSGSGWYDPQYKSSNNDHPDTWNSAWASPSADVGDYNHEAKDSNYAGGEFLDAFVFANFDIGDTAIGVRAGKHTIYWGNSLLGTAAIASIGSVMAPLDFAKALSVPGSEAKELFMPTNKISTVVQLTDNLTINAYYGLEQKAYRLPETGTFFSPAVGLTEDSEYLTFLPNGRDTRTVPLRTGYHSDGFEADGNDYGVNVQYYVDAWSLETSFIYINYTDKNLHGLHAGFDLGQYGNAVFDNDLTDNPFYPTFAQLMPAWNAFCEPLDFDCPTPTYDQGGGALVAGEAKFLFKEEIDLFGISLAKEIAGVSVGLDLVYRKDTGLSQAIGPALGQFYNAPDSDLFPTGEEIQALSGLIYIPGDYYSYNGDDKYPGPLGDVYSVVLNGIGLLNGDLGLWDGGSWILETTFTMLKDCNKNCDQLKTQVSEDRVVSHVAGVFRPTWYQVFPGWDMTLPMSVSYQIDGEANPMTFGGDEERGNGSIGVQFLVNQVWTLDAKYNTFFGPVNAGLGALNKDRDNISMTVKRTW
jgi:hypothetical protein